jgi:WD40 repeat protein
VIGTGTTVANETYDVFISYSRLDWRHATEIDSNLRAKGLKSFFDRRNLTPGLPWVRALEQAIGSAKAAIVLIGPHGFGNTQQYERDLALYRQGREPKFPVVPVILPETTTDRPFDFLQVLTWIDFSHVAKVSEAPLELEHLLAAVRGRKRRRKGEVVAREAICPYRGLDAFREEDSAFFFGRGSADDPNSPIGELVRKVREQPFVIVVGRSGSGKSSLIYAGLLPALRRERDQFRDVLSLRPGPTPLRALAAAFNPRADSEGAAEYETKITNEANQLRTGDPELLSHMIRRWLDQAEGKPDRLLLYVDQWEELYAQAPSSNDKERVAQHTADVNRFIDLLLNASRTAPVAVVGTVRADFYDPLIGHPHIRTLLPTRQVLLAAMSRSELESTIVEPAKKVGLTFGPPSLVQRILDEAGEDEGMLPLLQYALKESWALRKDNAITADAYARSGGVREAIRITAERNFGVLSAKDQQAARQLFLRLVTPGEGQEDTRARAAMPTEPMQRRIVEQFSGPRTRLLVTGSDRAQRPIVEVAHEALIRTWPRLRGWIDANREKLRARAAVLQAKTEWEQQGRREDLLLPVGFQLERARTLLADPGDLAIADIQEFITLSSARQEHERANILAELSETKLLRREIDSALRLASHGARIDLTLPSDVAKPSPAGAALASTISQTTWRFVLGGQDSRINSAAFSPDGSRIVTASNDRTARIWDATTAMEIVVLRGHDHVVNSAAFSPDGLRIVTASEDQTARIWDAASANEIAVLRGHDHVVNSAAFSPDGLRIVTASEDQTARIWDAASAKEVAVLRGHDDVVWSAAFSPDGSRIVTASDDNTARIWNTVSAQEIAVLSGHDNSVRSAAFSPELAQIVTASEDHTARIWDAATAQEISVLRNHEGRLNSAAFSPDGSRIVTASGDKTARIWDAVTAQEIAVLLGHDGYVNSAAFNPDGSRIVTASADKTARIWGQASAKEVAVLRGHDDVVYSAAFSPDGSRIVTASADETARIWSQASAKEVAVLRGHNDVVWSAAFSPDGSRIVTASDDRTARIWDAATAGEIAVIGGHAAVVGSAAFSPDGSRIVTASADQTARIWDTASAEQIAVLRGHDDYLNSAAFSHDGSRIITASADKTARIWDAASAKEIAVLRGHGGGVLSAAFSSDGSRIVTASRDNTARIWDTATAKEMTVLLGHKDYVVSAAFSPNGSRIVTASRDWTARIWDAASGKEIVVLRGHNDYVLSAAFCADGSHIVTASGDETARIWEVHLQTISVKDLLAEACVRLAGLAKLTRDEMRLASYPDSMPEIDVCQ